MSDDNSAATDNTGANSDEFHSADEADGTTRSPQADGGKALHRRDRASSSSSGSDSEPEANRATLPSEAAAQQSSNDHASSQPEAMQDEGAIAAAAPPSEPDEHEKRDKNDAKSESSAIEADHLPSAVVDLTSVESSGHVSDLPVQDSDVPFSAASTAEAKLTGTAVETKTPEHKADKLADIEAVNSALSNCSLTEGDRIADSTHVESSLAAVDKQAAQNGVHIEAAGDDEAVDGDGDILHCDEGPSILELSSKDDPRVSPRPPHEQQDNAHVMELDDDGQYDDDDDDDDDDGASGEDGATPDDDEDVHNPAFIPKVGRFYMHDRRTYDEEEDADKKAEARPGRADAVDKWQHDRFEERSQRPKENVQLVQRYGHDIRSDDRAPEGDFPRTDNRRARGAPRGARGRPGQTRGGSGHPPPQQQQRRGGGSGGFDAADFPPLQSRSNEAAAGDSYQPRGRARGTSSSGFRGNADRRGGGGWPRRGADRRPDDANHPTSYQTREFRNSGRASGRGTLPERGSHRDTAVSSNRSGGDRRNFDNVRDSQSTRHSYQQHDGPRRNDDSSRGASQQQRSEGQPTGGRGGGKRYSAQRPQQQNQNAEGAQDVRQQDGGGQFRQTSHAAYAQQQQPYYEPGYQRAAPFAGPPMQQQFGGQYSGPAAAAPYSGPQEAYHNPSAPYIAGPGGQPRQPTGAVYFDPGQQRERPPHHSNRPHKGIPIVAPDESVH